MVGFNSIQIDDEELCKVEEIPKASKDITNAATTFISPSTSTTTITLTTSTTTSSSATNPFIIRTNMTLTTNTAETDESNRIPRIFIPKDYNDDDDEVMSVGIGEFSIWFILMISAGVAVVIGLILMAVWLQFRSKRKNQRPEDVARIEFMPDLFYNGMNEHTIEHLTYEDAMRDSVDGHDNNEDNDYDEPLDDGYV